MSGINNPVAAGVNLKLDPIDRFITAGVAKRCRQVFCPYVAWLSSTDKTRVLQRMFGNTAAGEADTSFRTVYPYMLLTLNNVALAQDRMNTKYGASRGLPAVLSTDGIRTYNVNFLPANFSVTVELYTPLMEDVTSYTTRWLFANRQNLLAFDVDYGRASFGITVEMDESLSVPQRDATTGNLAEYVVSSSFIVKGYVSEAVLIEAQVAKDVAITHVVDTQGGSTVSSSSWTFRATPASDTEAHVPTSSSIR